MTKIIKKIKELKTVIPKEEDLVLLSQDGVTRNSKIEDIRDKDLKNEITTARGTKDSLGERIDDIDENLSATTKIKGTTQSIIFNSDGTVQRVQHKDSSNNLMREDVFTYSTNTITEVRTLSDGKTLTLINHLDTLTTEVI
jgi:hypothetical protein